MKFFSNAGLTNTSANHIANLAKEFIQESLETLNGVKFYSEVAKLLISDQITTISVGDKEFDSSKIKDITDAYSLCAWIREAIKKKDSLLNNIEYNIPDIPHPQKQDYVTENDYLETLNEDQLFKYYQLDAKCATLGKLIHKDCPLNNARKELFKIIKSPNRIEGTGQDSIVFTRKPSINPETVNEQFFNLQNEYREAQAQLNKMKYDAEQWVNDRNNEIETKYNKELFEYNEQQRVRRNQIDEYIKSEREKIRNYKIIIPQALKPIYEKINNLGK